MLRRLDGLGEADWEQVCPAPAPAADVVRLDDPQRSVREVVAHLLVSDEIVLRGGSIRALTGRGGLEHPGAWDLRRIAPLASAPPAELVALLAERGRRFGRLVRAAPAPLRRIPVRGPFGRQAPAQLVTRRVLHEWLHEQDIAAAAPGADSGPTAAPAVAEAVADAVLGLLPGDVLPRIALAEGVVRLLVEFGGDGSQGQHRCEWGLDFGRRQYGPRVLRRPATTITMAATTLALLAHGRSERLPAEPCVDVEGDGELAEALLGAFGAPRATAPCVPVRTKTRAVTG